LIRPLFSRRKEINNFEQLLPDFECSVSSPGTMFRFLDVRYVARNSFGRKDEGVAFNISEQLTKKAGVQLWVKVRLVEPFDNKVS
jgi:hypothetical protein